MKRSVKLQKVLGTDLSSFSSQTYTAAALNRDFSDYSVGFNPMSFAKQVRRVTG